MYEERAHKVLGDDYYDIRCTGEEEQSSTLFASSLSTAHSSSTWGAAAEEAQSKGRFICLFGCNGLSVEISKHVQADVGISSYVTILLFAYVPSAFVFTGCMSSVSGGGRVLSIQIEYLEYTRFPFASHNDPESVGTTHGRHWMEYAKGQQFVRIIIILRLPGWGLWTEWRDDWLSGLPVRCALFLQRGEL